MLTLETARTATGAARSELRRLPRLTRTGLWVFALGLLADVALHVMAGDLADPRPDHSGPELIAHYVVFVGMVLIFAGVVGDGVRQSRARAASERTKEGAA